MKKEKIKKYWWKATASFLMYCSPCRLAMP